MSDASLSLIPLLNLILVIFILKARIALCFLTTFEKETQKPGDGCFTEQIITADRIFQPLFGQHKIVSG